MHPSSDRTGLGRRLEALDARHRALESRIRDEMKRPLPEFLSLQALKRRKLVVKDEIEAIEGVLRTLARRPELKTRAHRPA